MTLQNLQHSTCAKLSWTDVYQRHSTAVVPSKSKLSHSISMKALLSSTHFWASGYAKWTVHHFFCSTYPHQMELQLKTTNLVFHMLLNPLGGISRIWNANQWLQNRQSSGKAAKHVSDHFTFWLCGIHYLTAKDWIFMVKSAGALIHLGTAWFFRHCNEGIFAVPSSEARCFVKLASCMEVFWKCLACL